MAPHRFERGVGGLFVPPRHPRGVFHRISLHKTVLGVYPMSDLRLSWTATIRQMILDVVAGAAREYAVYGPRSEGKTHGVLGAMLGHATEHQRRGYPTPVGWIGVADTFQSHKLKTVRSAEDPLWQGCWQAHDSGHEVVARVGGRAVVRLDLFGIEDQGAKDRVRMGTTGVWFEEPAPTGTEESSGGMDEATWDIAITSQGDRAPSYTHPAIMTLNYPHEDHWTWQRFLPSAFPLPSIPPREDETGRADYYRQYARHIVGTHPDDPTRRWYRIPPGERASAKDRAAWAHALRHRPDLLRRLIEGRPGSVLLGLAVAEGFREDLHVSPTRLEPVADEPLLVGVDFGHTPTVIIGQVWHGERRVLYASACEHGGIKQHFENEVLPWVATHCPWALRQQGKVVGCYDPAGETGEQSDIERDPVSTMEALWPGLWYPGPVTWDTRKHTLLGAVNHTKSAGQPSLRIDPVDARDLVKALSSRWYYPTDRHGKIRRDLPKKPNHPWEDYGDAFIYWLWGLTTTPTAPSIAVDSTWSIFDRSHGR